MSEVTSGATMLQPSVRRMSLPTNALTGLVLGVLGYWAGVQIGNGLGFNDSGNTGVLLGYALGSIMFLVGIGFATYPLGRLLGWQTPSQPAYDEYKGAWRYLNLSFDHKVIGIQYLIVMLMAMLFGGIGAMFVRTNLLSADTPIFPPDKYLTLVSMHSVLMIFVASAAIVGPFGNFFVPLMIGTNRMAFPRLEALSLWLVPPALVVMLLTPVFGGFQTGWTGYTPLSEQGGQGFDSYIVGFTLIGTALVVSGVNMLTTIITMRAPGMTWTRMPIFVWGVFSASILGTFAAPVLAAALCMQALDRSMNTSFYVSSNGGSPYLWQNLFWIFGHPEVYIFILPAFGIVMELIPHFARKPLWGYRTAVVGLLGVTLLSWFVWQHHLFVSGIAPALRPFYMLSTEMISIPTGIVFLVAFGTLWRARISLTVPMLFSLGFLYNFLIGGISGVFLSDVPSDITLHGSYFSMAHFHFTIVGGEIFAIVAAIYYWFPKMTGRMLNATAGKIHFWWMFISFNLAFTPLFAVGILDMPRRVSTYAPNLQGINDWVTIWAYVLFSSMVFFAGIVIWGWFFNPKLAVADPWHVRSIEWELATPLPRRNFERIPTFTRPPYDYGEGAPRPVIEHGAEPAPA
ncbi:MAG TPA: cbb3-type cytochrome c oxidase subunit I [Candidatus Baltobacterales bacterium]|nr:cbb3-type cytochrome c oxidase subunit I [Candidatus Baltobacterales bacterium]